MKRDFEGRMAVWQEENQKDDGEDGEVGGGEGLGDGG